MIIFEPILVVIVIIALLSLFGLAIGLLYSQVKKQLKQLWKYLCEKV